MRDRSDDLDPAEKTPGSNVSTAAPHAIQFIGTRIISITNPRIPLHIFPDRVFVIFEIVMISLFLYLHRRCDLQQVQGPKGHLQVVLLVVTNLAGFRRDSTEY
jgi:hypothetical protein